MRDEQDAPVDEAAGEVDDLEVVKVEGRAGEFGVASIFTATAPPGTSSPERHGVP